MAKPVTRAIDKALKDLESQGLIEYHTPIQRGMGKNGWADRIAYMNGGRTIFIEIKEEGDKERALQAKLRKRLTKLDFIWVVAQTDFLSTIISTLYIMAGGIPSEKGEDKNREKQIHRFG